ncbi:MAG: molecular chaperone HtpG [Ruminococcaceae bacterium]|nr:molecular chaperone HtpG [Oscillospiraceae bacterium]
MAKKQFKAESKRLLDLMINSIYTHKEIFLREIISNASDAIDKLYYHALSSGDTGLSRDDFEIFIESDTENRTITISDNGCGMTKEDLENNLGTIAKSGSLSFKQENEKNEEIDIIGQFGVGFYSAFMVAESVAVYSKAYGADTAYKWYSEGADGYTVTECEKDSHGTKIVLTIKEDTEEEDYTSFLNEYTLRRLIKKYSDYIRYPIKMEITSSRMNEETKEFEEYKEITAINSMVPLWRKNKNEIEDEEYNEFYRMNFGDFAEPLKVINTSTEGTATYNALLFIPSKAPYNYYNRDYEKGLRLYASGVLIMDTCKDLVPDHFSFVKGLVDSQDLSLNISREMLQHDRQLKLISSRLEKKIKSELLSMLRNDREKYEEFYAQFGLNLKYGLYSGYGETTDLLKDLIMFESSFEDKLVTLEEYVSRMKEEQKFIYYATGESKEKISRLPQAEAIMDKGYEILYLTQDVDEFMLKIMGKFDEKEFRSISSEDLGIETEEEKEEAKKKADMSREMLEFMKESLDGKVAEVRLSSRLKSHPVCLTAKGELSLEMEKVLTAMPNDTNVKAERVLEINAEHKIFSTLTSLFENDKEKVAKYASLLYSQALLIEGLGIEDPVEFSNLICELM